MKIFASLLICLMISVSALANSSEKQLAENFSATTLNGKPITLEQFRGKTVVLMFWSTRCSICSSEIPKVNKLVEKFANRNVEFLALSMENENLISNYVKKKAFNATLIPNSLGIIMQYALKNANGSFEIAYPTFFVINPNGEIELKASGRKSGAVESELEKLTGKF